jgi:pyruvate,water dikinase
MTDIRTFEQIRPDDGQAIGGKGLNLGRLTAAGFPVPPGFCVTSSAYRRLRSQSPQADQHFREQVSMAYRRLGAGRVAVRSSATMEDGAAFSFAGQQETSLGAEGEEAVLDAIARCWASVESERARAYRMRHGVKEGDLEMAVVVQQLVPAEVSGVLFTQDPFDPEDRRMLVEASWGLGESVVSGRVSPDQFHLDRQTGEVLERNINRKTTLLTVNGRACVAAERQNQPCLDSFQLDKLAELGRRVEAFYGHALDVEWAWENGRLWLLQARAITTPGAAEREQARREEIAALRARADPRGTVWSRYNLSETLPAPTPMTWAIVSRFLSGRGGLGLMYRDLGFEPDLTLDEEGIYDLVCGRPYCNLSREPGMYRQGLPLEHSFAALRATPQNALYPRAEPNWLRADWRFWLFFPLHVFKSIRVAWRLAAEQRKFAQRFCEKIIPAFAEQVASAASQDLSTLSARALMKQLEEWIRVTLYDFARESLKPTVLAAHAMAGIEKSLASLELSMGAHVDPEADLARAIRDLAGGKMDRTVFLERFGHRGSEEMELASPRWAEDPRALDGLIQTHQADRQTRSVNSTETGVRRGKDSLEGVKKDLPMLHTWLGLRETAKHHLMRGYALIRRILVELDRRYHLDGGVFYLVPEELPRLLAGEDFSKQIAERRRRRALLLSLEVPPVLFSDNLEAIGRPVVTGSGDRLQGIPLSPGIAEGPALVMCDPTSAEIPAAPYILVCPSTDPAWVPLFVHARGLIMETGGILSHGAIVAREFGVPAVAGLPGIHRHLRSGQQVRVDGGAGTVTVLETA